MLICFPLLSVLFSLLKVCPRLMDPNRFVAITNYYLERVGIDVTTLELRNDEQHG